MNAAGVNVSPTKVDHRRNRSNSDSDAGGGDWPPTPLLTEPAPTGSAGCVGCVGVSLAASVGVGRPPVRVAAMLPRSHCAARSILAAVVSFSRGVVPRRTLLM